MRALVLRVIFGTATLAASVAPVSIAVAQMHKVAKPQQVVRAIGVYEWTGDFGKPTASRLIPVSLYIEGKFEDAGVYIARPVPFALLSGNVYILQTAGVDKGTLDLAYAKHLQAVEPTGDMAFDDGWFGYGSVKPLSAPRKTTTAALKPSKTVPAITTTTDPNRPHFGSKPTGDTTSSTGGDQSKPDTTASGTKTTSTSDDSDRPTMKRRSSDTTSPGTTSSGTTNSGTTSSPTAADSGSTPSTASTPSDDPNRPTMKRRSSDTASPDATTSGSDTTTTASNPQTGSTPADDPDRPTMKRRSPDATTSGTDTTASSTQTGSAPADDPDRPTMKRGSSSDSTTTDTASTTSNGNAPADDPDRPTLKRHSAEDARRAGSAASDIGGGGSVESLNNDPNRPNLHHGKPVSSMTEEDLPKLTGIPPNLHQMVAVSDAVNRDPHLFTLEWDDEAQHQAILQKMQALARTQLAAYATTPATATSAPASPAKKTPPASTRSRRTPAQAPPLPLFDEQLKAYTLSYGGDPTYVYSANTGGTGAALRYVTIVAQANSLGEIKPAIQSVTDAAHLYRTPKMQFIDVVDAEASNRASLLFELRSQNARQFALYRVIASHPEQIFLTGTTQ
jgi:hypothetical protein